MIGNLCFNPNIPFCLFPGHRYQRQSALVLRAGVLVRHPRECAARLSSRLDFRHRSRSRRQLDADIHRDFRLGEWRLLAEPSNRRFHLDGSIGLWRGEWVVPRVASTQRRENFYEADKNHWNRNRLLHRLECLRSDEKNALFFHPKNITKQMKNNNFERD